MARKATHKTKQHALAHPVAAKDAEDVVVQRQEEARRPLVPLPARAAPELVVDAPRLVPLRADDIEAALAPDLVVVVVVVLVVQG